LKQPVDCYRLEGKGREKTPPPPINFRLQPWSQQSTTVTVYRETTHIVAAVLKGDTCLDTGKDLGEVLERLTTANTAIIIIIIIIIIITSSSSQSASGIGSGEHHSAKDQSSTAIAGAELFANLTSPLYRFRIDYRTRTEAKPSQIY